MDYPVHIFWDNSNIFIPARDVASRREGTVFAEQLVRIQFGSLYQLAHANRPVESAFCVGSETPSFGAVRQQLSYTPIQLEFFERGITSRREQGVDQCLQTHMLRALADSTEPSVAVLLSGDGAGYETGAGFHADLERMADAGWGIEVLSWNGACNRALRSWAEAVGVYVSLDDYYKSITFCEGGRMAVPLSLTHRPFAEPRC